MSLTDLVKTQAYKEIANLDFVFPRVQIQPVIPTHKDLLDPKHLGKAIDFFLRARLEKDTPPELTTKRRQVHETAWAAVQPYCSDLCDEIIEKSRLASEAILRFLCDDWNDEDIVRALLDMAYMDSIARSYPDENGKYALSNLIGEGLETQETRGELLKYITGDLSYLPTIEKNLNLGPAFGKSGRDINGADADLIADGTIYDIKFTMSPSTTVNKYSLMQAVGYAYLNKIEGNLHGDIHSVGLIFPRQRSCVKFKLSEISKVAIPLSRFKNIEKLICNYKSGADLYLDLFIGDKGSQLREQSSFTGF